jgi:hypothetical protein
LFSGPSPPAAASRKSFTKEADGLMIDNAQHQKRPLALYAEGIKWLNWAVEMLEGKKPSSTPCRSSCQPRKENNHGK